MNDSLIKYKIALPLKKRALKSNEISAQKFQRQPTTNCWKEQLCNAN